MHRLVIVSISLGLGMFFGLLVSGVDSEELTEYNVVDDVDDICLPKMANEARSKIRNRAARCSHGVEIREIGSLHQR